MHFPFVVCAQHPAERHNFAIVMRSPFRMWCWFIQHIEIFWSYFFLSLSLKWLIWYIFSTLSDRMCGALNHSSILFLLRFIYIYLRLWGCFSFLLLFRAILYFLFPPWKMRDENNKKWAQEATITHHPSSSTKGWKSKNMGKIWALNKFCSVLWSPMNMRDGNNKCWNC